MNKVYVLLITGQFTETINGTKVTAQRTELIKAYTSYDKAKLALEEGKIDAKEPYKWEVRAICIEEVEVIE